MDRSWMKYPYRPDYVNGLREFLVKAKQHLDPIGRTRCPCMKCNNSSFKHIEEVEKHLFRVGMHRDYTRWVYHGEEFEVLSKDEDEDADCGNDGHGDGIGDLLADIGASINMSNPLSDIQHEDTNNAHDACASESNAPKVGIEGDTFDKLLREAREPLYPGCTTFSKLEFLVKLLHEKMLNSLSNKAFDGNIKLVKKALPVGETLPNNYYEVKTFIYMSLLIPGPTAPGNDIDVYLQPLIDELIDLWEHGVETYDATTKKTFQLHAALLWTINDFPAYANLSGWSSKGKLACPNCNKDTFSIYLKKCHKLCYMNQSHFLNPRHSLRSRASQVLGGRIFDLRRPKNLSGDDLLSQLEQLRAHSFGKNPNNRKRKRIEDELNWTKKSIFFDLPYWRTLKLRHNLDVMHIEKNICESVLGTILKMEGKTKDTINA